MPALGITEKLLAFTFLVATLLSVGLRTTVADLRALLASRGLMTRVLVANFVVVPLLGFAIARIFPLPREIAVALVMLACVPGGLSALQFASKVKGEEALAGATLVVLNLLAIAVSPAILRALEPPDDAMLLRYGRLLGFLALAVLVPLVLGIAANARMPRAAAKLGKVLGIVGVVAFVAFMTVTKGDRKEALRMLGGLPVLAMLVFLAASMLAGWLLGGPTHERRQLLANATSMRNAALCLAIAKVAAPAESAVPLVGFSLLMVPPNMLLMLFGTLRARRIARRTGAAEPASKAS